MLASPASGGQQSHLVGYCDSCMYGLLAHHLAAVVGGIQASGEASPAMLWPMWIVYSVMLIGFVLAVLRGLQQMYIHVTHFNEKELTTIEQTMRDAAEEAALAKGGEE